MTTLKPPVDAKGNELPVGKKFDAVYSDGTVKRMYIIRDNIVDKWRVFNEDGIPLFTTRPESISLISSLPTYKDGITVIEEGHIYFNAQLNIVGVVKEINKDRKEIKATNIEKDGQRYGSRVVSFDYANRHWERIDDALEYIKEFYDENAWEAIEEFAELMKIPWPMLWS